ncbi:uncharacterized protein LOC130712750 [Lotus japonicus]|uniref:uncharacterized protein LOC130712750 n=1 Tax=Lotus japonicus TaxID=34305 RepID=UPI002587358B|nr:uncharacterized protein LOC130712750 [Lotus japonicus]
MKIEYVNGNRMLPKVNTDASFITELCSPWQEALVITLLGKRLGYRTLKSRLVATWRLVGDFDLLDIDNGFYMVKFDIAADRAKVMEGGPWMIFDHYLAVATWSKEFLSPVAKVTKTLAWIRIPGLNVVFYDESYLLGVASAVGRAIRVDSNTLRAERGKFARICVELDLTMPVIGKVCIEGHWHKIEYEGLHIICSRCGCYGHRTRECTAAPLVFMPSHPVAPPQADNTEKTVTGQDTPINAPEAVSNGDVIMGTSSAESAEGKMNVESAISVVTSGHDEGTEILGDWLVVSRKKRGPKAQAKSLNEGKSKSKEFKNSNVRILNKEDEAIKAKVKHAGPTSTKEKVFVENIEVENQAGPSTNKGKKITAGGDMGNISGVHHLNMDFGEKVWIKKRKEGPTLESKGNFKTQNSKFSVPTTDFQMGRVDSVIANEKDTATRVRDYLRLHGVKPQINGAASSFMAKENPEVVFQAGNISVNGTRSRPPNEKAVMDQVTKVPHSEPVQGPKLDAIQIPSDKQ